MTTDLSGCSDSAFPDFSWDDFESILLSTEEQANPLVRGHVLVELQRLAVCQSDIVDN